MQEDAGQDWLLPLSFCALLLSAYGALLFGLQTTFLPWSDEVQLADPAANLFFNGHFTSSVWPYQTPDQYFVGNAPLFSAILGVWFKMFGFGALQARSLCWFFGLVGVCAGILVVVQERILSLRLAPFLVALFLMGGGFAISVWSARYDSLGFALVALLIVGLSRPQLRLRRVITALALILAPSA